MFQGLRDLALPDLHVHSTLLPVGSFQHSDLQVGAPCLKCQLDLRREIRRATAIRTSLSRSQKREIGGKKSFCFHLSPLSHIYQI